MSDSVPVWMASQIKERLDLIATAEQRGIVAISLDRLEHPSIIVAWLKTVVLIQLLKTLRRTRKKYKMIVYDGKSYIMSRIEAIDLVASELKKREQVSKK